MTVTLGSEAMCMTDECIVARHRAAQPNPILGYVVGCTSPAYWGASENANDVFERSVICSPVLLGAAVLVWYAFFRKGGKG